MPRLFPRHPRYDRGHALAEGQVGCFIPVAGGSFIDATGYNTPIQDDLPREDGVGPYGVAPHPLAAGDGTVRCNLGSIISSNPLSLAGVTTLTIAWHGVLHGAGGGGFGRLIDKSSAGASADGWSVFPSGTAGITLQINTVSLTSDANFYTVDEEADWAIVRYGTSTNEVSFYKNGVLHTAGTLATTIPTTTTDAAIGSWNHSATNRQWDGRIDWLQVWERALTAAEVLALVHDPLPHVGNQRPFLSNYFDPDIGAVSTTSTSIAGYGGIAGPGGIAGAHGGIAG
jgi:hypothetical protein